MVISDYKIRRRIAAIGPIIIEKREAAEMDQGELIAASGISRTTIAPLEAGKAKGVTVKTLAKIASVLGCSVPDLLPGGF